MVVLVADVSTGTRGYEYQAESDGNIVTPNRIGVVTPVGPASGRLVNAIESVAAQSHSVALHVAVFDGHEPTERDSRVKYITLPVPCEDTGATPRAVGANFALAQHCDALAFLDADNTWEPYHLESLVEAATNYDIVVAKRRICDANGEPMYDDEHESNGVEFADTNCYLLTGKAVQIARLWGDVPRAAGVRTATVDRYFWEHVKARNCKVGFTGKFTVNYRSRWLAHYRRHPERRPNRCKVLDHVDGIPTVKWM